jgi:membrane-associated protein
MTELFDWLRASLSQHGYAAVAAILLLENAGLPVPGETVLLLASFMAFSQHRLQLGYLILVGIAASALGNGCGYAVGFFGGRRLLDRYRQTLRIAPETVARGEQLFANYGALTVLVARFIAGLRFLAGPLAGVLRMPWKKFAIWNVVGAVLWVTAISSVGYLFGQHWDLLVEALKSANLLALLLAVALGVLLWWRARRSRKHP